MNIAAIVSKQKAFYQTGATKKYSNRLEALHRLEQAILRYEPEITAALSADLNKSSFESYMSEIGMVLGELRYMKKHLHSLCRPHLKPTPMAQFPSISFTYPEPYGCVLILSPWNYPFLLTMEPLIGAIAAGNCCVVKPANASSNTSSLIRRILSELYPAKYVTVVEGGHKENSLLLDQTFDYIFFTGSTRVGQTVLEKASRHLTPVSLELGGKSPCIVDESADLKCAARRILFGKLLNAGQTCVAPDYLLIQESVKDQWIFYAQKEIKRMYGEHPMANPNYPKIINQAHYDRLLSLLTGQHLLTGGEGDPVTLKLSPVLMDQVSLDAPVMKEEIFGPILPILTYRTRDEAVRLIRSVMDGAKPLAFYLFTGDRNTERYFLNRLSFGGGCINDTIVHLATPHMGFGGVGASGMGSYHGKRSFETFSHTRSMVKKSTLFDLPVRYQPVNRMKEKIMRRFV